MKAGRVLNGSDGSLGSEGLWVASCVGVWDPGQALAGLVRGREEKGRGRAGLGVSVSVLSACPACLSVQDLSGVRPGVRDVLSETGLSWDTPEE